MNQTKRDLLFSKVNLITAFIYTTGEIICKIINYQRPDFVELFWYTLILGHQYPGIMLYRVVHRRYADSMRTVSLISSFCISLTS